MPAETDHPVPRDSPRHSLDCQLQQLRRFAAWLACHHPEYRCGLFGITQTFEGREQLSFAFYKSGLFLGLYTSYEDLYQRLDDPDLKRAFRDWLAAEAPPD